MDSFNIFALIGFIIRLFSVSIILFYVIPKQFMEVLRPKNWLTGLRWQILLLFIFSIISAIPSLIYQFLRIQGIQNATSQNIAGISSNLSILASSMLLVLIYNYKNKSDN